MRWLEKENEKINHEILMLLKSENKKSWIGCQWGRGSLLNLETEAGSSPRPMEVRLQYVADLIFPTVSCVLLTSIYVNIYLLSEYIDIHLSTSTEIRVWNYTVMYICTEHSIGLKFQSGFVRHTNFVWHWGMSRWDFYSATDYGYVSCLLFSDSTLH